MNIKKHIPNFLTCMNLVSGCYGISYLTSHSLGSKGLLVACACIGISCLFDFFDGFAARLLKVSSDIGKELDSLADVVSFGVLPGFIMFYLIARPDYITPGSGFEVVGYLPYIAFLIPVFSALRLAKFNIDTRQTTSFIGVPTPANSIFIASLPLIRKFSSTYPGFIFDQYFLVCLTLVLCYLMVAEIPLFALKFKDFSWKQNKIKYIFLAISLLLILLLNFISIPIIIILYIILSLIDLIVLKKSIE